MHQSEFISIIADETTDISNAFQLVFILRYELNTFGDLRMDIMLKHEHRLFFPLSIHFFEKSPNKLVAQSYDSKAVMSENIWNECKSKKLSL